MPLIEAQGLKKTYHTGEVDVEVLRGIDLEIARGEFVAIIGASGSGKSTLLHLWAASMCRPADGLCWTARICRPWVTTGERCSAAPSRFHLPDLQSSAYVDR